jgi:hypothetical protein
MNDIGHILEVFTKPSPSDPVGAACSRTRTVRNRKRSRADTYGTTDTRAHRGAFGVGSLIVVVRILCQSSKKKPPPGPKPWGVSYWR